MTIVQATVIARATTDGLIVFNDDVPLGKTYLVDLDTIRRNAGMIHQFDNGVCVEHTKDIIYVAGEAEPRWLPLDLLRLSVPS
jgi:hypothetical protein